jgi:general stress protein YciG
MANNQDWGANQGGNANTGAGDAGQKGGQGAGGDMLDKQKGTQQPGQKPEDKMNKDWERSTDTGRQGGQPGADQADRQGPADTGRMGGQADQGDTQHKDDDR